MFRRKSRYERQQQRASHQGFNTGIPTTAAAAAAASAGYVRYQLAPSAAAEAIRRHSLDQSGADAIANFPGEAAAAQPPIGMRRTASMTLGGPAAPGRHPGSGYARGPAPGAAPGRTGSLTRANSLSRSNSMTRANSLTRTHTTVNRDASGRTMSLTTTTVRHMGSFEIVTQKETHMHHAAAGAAAAAGARRVPSNGSLRGPAPAFRRAPAGGAGYADSVHSYDSELAIVEEEPQDGFLSNYTAHSSPGTYANSPEGYAARLSQQTQNQNQTQTQSVAPQPQARAPLRSALAPAVREDEEEEEEEDVPIDRGRAAAAPELRIDGLPAPERPTPSPHLSAPRSEPSSRRSLSPMKPALRDRGNSVSSTEGGAEKKSRVSVSFGADATTQEFTYESYDYDEQFEDPESVNTPANRALAAASMAASRARFREIPTKQSYSTDSARAASRSSAAAGNQLHQQNQQAPYAQQPQQQQQAQYLPQPRVQPPPQHHFEVTVEPREQRQPQPRSQLAQQNYQQQVLLQQQQTADRALSASIALAAASKAPGAAVKSAEARRGLDIEKYYAQDPNEPVQPPKEPEQPAQVAGLPTRAFTAPKVPPQPVQQPQTVQPPPAQAQPAPPATPFTRADEAADGTAWADPVASAPAPGLTEQAATPQGAAYSPASVTSPETVKPPALAPSSELVQGPTDFGVSELRSSDLNGGLSAPEQATKAPAVLAPSPLLADSFETPSESRDYSPGTEVAHMVPDALDADVAVPELTSPSAAVSSNNASPEAARGPADASPIALSVAQAYANETGSQSSVYSDAAADHERDVDSEFESAVSLYQSPKARPAEQTKTMPPPPDGLVPLPASVSPQAAEQASPQAVSQAVSSQSGAVPRGPAPIAGVHPRQPTANVFAGSPAQQARAQASQTSAAAEAARRSQQQQQQQQQQQPQQVYGQRQQRPYSQQPPPRQGGPQQRQGPPQQRLSQQYQRQGAPVYGQRQPQGSQGPLNQQPKSYRPQSVQPPPRTSSEHFSQRQQLQQLQQQQARQQLQQQPNGPGGPRLSQRLSQQQAPLDARQAASRAQPKPQPQPQLPAAQLQQPASPLHSEHSGSPSQNDAHHYRQLIEDFNRAKMLEDDDAASINSESSFKRSRPRNRESFIKTAPSGERTYSLRGGPPRGFSDRRSSANHSPQSPATPAAPAAGSAAPTTGRTWSLRGTSRPDPRKLLSEADSRHDYLVSLRDGGGDRGRRAKGAGFRSRISESDSEDEGAGFGKFLSGGRRESRSDREAGGNPGKIGLKEIFSPNTDARTLLPGHRNLQEPEPVPAPKDKKKKNVFRRLLGISVT